MPSFLDSAKDFITSAPQKAVDVAGDIVNFGDRTVNDDSLSQSKYEFGSLVFPNDLGSENLGHYIIFNINVPVNSNGGSATQRGAYQFDEVLQSDYSKVDVLRFGQFSGYGGQSAQALARPRYTRRIAKSIAMHVPSQLIVDTTHEWQDISLTALGGEILTGAASAVGGVAAGALNLGGVTGGLGSSIVGAVGDAISPLINNVTKVAAFAGKPINPLIEVLFSHTHLKTYTFEFLLVPRNAEEAKSIELIIRNLRFYSAPEIDPNMNLFFIPPAEFDITIYNKGKENTHIPRFNTSVLRRLQVNYIPFNDVFGTYYDGNPIATLMTMEFMEVEILHKQRVLQGF